jgi:NlpC/P60 family
MILRPIAGGLVTLALLLLWLGPGGQHTTVARAASLGDYHLERLADPERTVVSDANGDWVATFTDRAYTVTLAGPSRTLADVGTTATVTLADEVRLLDAPFSGAVDPDWLEIALARTDPDVVDLAMQYVKGAPIHSDEAGHKIAGESAYGPIGADGTRQEGADFYDYLGAPWTVDGQEHRPSSAQANSLDCSGFVRMVFGYRGGLPLGLEMDGKRLPRRAYQILDDAPGVVTIPDQDQRPASLDALSTGDLVFFDADPGDGPLIDHVGIFLGPDRDGHPRFLSSRKTANGPTLGDLGGRSVLDGNGLYARAFRAARRL